MSIKNIFHHKPEYSLYTDMRIMLILFIFIVYCFFSLHSRLNLAQEKIEEKKIAINKYEEDVDNIIDEKFKIYRNVYKVFYYYNQDVNDSALLVFLKTVKYYKLDTSNFNLYLSLSQLVHESGLKQYREHKTKGELVIRGFHGEVGMCQILPSTAFLVLKKMDKSTLDLMVENLNCTHPNFLKTKNRWQRNKEIIKWLSNIKNNLALWGHLMNSYYEETGDLYKALHIYNAGHGGYGKWVKLGRNSKRFKYVSTVMAIKAKIEQDIVN